VSGVARLVIAMATVLLLCSTIAVVGADILALADTSATTSEVSSLTSASPTSTEHEKSGRTAFLSSFLTTAVLGTAAVLVKTNTGDQSTQSALGTTTALGIAAYLAGPSIGHFYAGRPGRAWAGVGVRGLIGLGFTATAAASIDEDVNNDQDALIVALLVAGAGAMVFDIATAPHSAHVHNEKVRRMSISPASVGGAPGLRVDVGL
jgi:hypothetical protein